MTCPKNAEHLNVTASRLWTLSDGRQALLTWIAVRDGSVVLRRERDGAVGSVELSRLVDKDREIALMLANLTDTHLISQQIPVSIDRVRTAVMETLTNNQSLMQGVSSLSTSRINPSMIEQRDGEFLIHITNVPSNAEVPTDLERRLKDDVTQRLLLSERDAASFRLRIVMEHGKRPPDSPIQKPDLLTGEELTIETTYCDSHSQNCRLHWLPFRRR